MYCRRCTVVLASAGGNTVHQLVSVRVNGRAFDARLRRRQQLSPEQPPSTPSPVWASDDPWGTGLRLCVGPQAMASSIVFRFTVAETADAPTVGSAEKTGVIRAGLTRLAATASPRAGSSPRPIVVDDALAHGEIHMPAKIYAVEMRGVVEIDQSTSGGSTDKTAGSAAPSAWQIGTDRTFAALRRTCAFPAAESDGDATAQEQSPRPSAVAELRVKLQTLWQPCAIFRGFDGADGSDSAAAAAGMVHLPPAALKAAKQRITEQDVSVLHFLIDGTAAMRGPSAGAARDTVLACLAAIRVDVGRRLSGKRLGLQIEVFGSEQSSSSLLCPSGPVKCDAAGLASAEKWARYATLAISSLAAHFPTQSLLSPCGEQREHPQRPRRGFQWLQRGA